MRIREDSRLKASLWTFLNRSEGSVATIFAIAIVPILIAVGIGVDLSRAMSSRSNLQDSLDATALALAHMPLNTSQEVLDQKAATWMQANLRDKNMTPPFVTVKLNKGEVVLTASSTVPTTIAAITGYKAIPIGADSVVKWGLNHIEVVLVLDNTGSMAGTKLQRLKDAAKSLVETLEGQVGGGDANMLKIGVVPFSMTVRLTDSTQMLNEYKDKPWMSGVMPTQYGRDMFSNNNGADLTDVDRFSLFDTLGQPWNGCVEMRAQPYDVQDTAPSSATPASLFVPYFAPDEPDKNALAKPGQGGSNYYTSYNDYLDDERDDNQAKNKVGNNRFNRWLYMQGYIGKYDETVDPDLIEDGKGPNAGCSLQPMLRLTTSMSSVKTLLTNMTAVGNTNIPIGLMWGWHVLSPNLPFADGVAYSDKDTQKVIVLLTDGDNVNGEANNPNNSTYSTIGYAWQKRMAPMDEDSDENARTVHMDKRMETLCANIKGAGIAIYAVRIDMSGKASKALSGCASKEEMFYDIDSTGLSEAFKDIAGSIGKLRIAL